MAKQENKSTRNDGRTTHVIGVLVDLKNQNFQPFECDVPYVRSVEKAAKSVADVMQLTDEIMVSISELQQTEIERKIYDNAKLYAADAEMFIEEEEAKAHAKEIGAKCVQGFIYNYQTNVWYIDANGDYQTELFDYMCGGNFTAIDARSMLAMRFEEQHKGAKVLNIHHTESPRGFSKADDIVWYVINNEELAKCEREIKHRAK